MLGNKKQSIFGFGSCQLRCAAGWVALWSVSLFSAPAALAAPDLVVGFDGLSANNLADVSIGESQLSVTVSDLGQLSPSGPFRVRFIFTNSGPLPSSITDVYFDDGDASSPNHLSDLLTIDNSSAGTVSFSEGAKPNNLPNGLLAFTSTYNADADPPPGGATGNGVNPGEWVAFDFSLNNGVSFTDVTDAIAAGDLRIGMHVQSFNSGGSEWFVNGPPAVVPTPTAALGALAGLGFVPFGRRRHHNKIA